MNISSETNFKVYTPPKISNEISKKTLDVYFNGDYSKSKFEKIRCIDISCGTGNLLLVFLEQLINLYKKEHGEYQYNHLWISGYDIDTEAIKILKRRLKELLARYNISKTTNEITKTNIKVKNGLLIEINQKYNIVLGNPPYFGEKNNKEIFEEMKGNKFGKENYEGKMDYAYFFIAKGIDLLKPNGTLTYITTNYWLKADHAKKLRKKVKENTRFIYINNYNKSVFKDAVGQHNMVFSLKKLEEISKEGRQKEICKTHSEIIDEEKSYKVKSNKLFNYKDKIVLAEKEQLERLNKIYENKTHTLDDLLNINQGIVSGCDKAFVFDHFDIEFEKYLKPFYKNKDIFQYRHENNKYWILYLNHKTEICEVLFNYLEKYENKLKNRREVLKKIINWWELQWSRDEQIFNIPKIVGKQRSKLNKFSYSEDEFYGSADIYYMTSKEKEINLFYILGYLNSSIFYEWFKYNGKTKGNSLELYATPLKETPIYYSKNQKEIEYIEKLVKKQIISYESERQYLINSYFYVMMSVPTEQIF